jgi:thiamine pyrophosphate-dependent acetolactate synthase large subunit-like protein
MRQLCIVLAAGLVHHCSDAESACAVCILQAFYLARTGRPGPVLVDVPKDIQQQLDMPDWDTPMAISGYMSR